MDLNEVHAFIAVARAGSFTKAARLLDMPKSTISRQVSRLEAHLDAQLLHRTTRRISLTEVGKAFFGRCHHAIEEIENAERAALDVLGKPSGLLRVATSFDMAQSGLAPLFPEFRRRYPDISLDISMSHRQVDLIAEGFDLALRGGTLDDSSLIARKLGGDTMCLVASPAYLDARGRPQTIADLEHHDGVLISQAMTNRRLRLRFSSPDGPVALPLTAWLSCNDFSILLQATLDGLGIASMLGNHISEHLDSGRLEIVLPECRLEGSGLYAVYPSTHHLTPKVRVFVDFLAECLSPRFAIK